MSLFTSYEFQVRCTGREALLTGGTNTWDPTTLALEVWADYDYGVAGTFNAVEEFERTIDILSTKPDLQDFLEKGFYYTHLCYIAERDSVKDDTLINSLTIQSAGRIWTPQGDKNYPLIQRSNRERFVTSAASYLSRTIFIPPLPAAIHTCSLQTL